MPDGQGSFIWYQRVTADMETARRFYRSVLDWRIAEDGGAPGPRPIIAPDGDAIGGIGSLDAEALADAARPGWFPYLCVDDVDAELAALRQAGGQARADWELPGIGRIVRVRDPQGTAFYLMDPLPPADGPDMVSTAFDPARPGHAVWNELLTPDPAAAEAYYCARFGWTRTGVIPMETVGDYVLLAKDMVPIGGLMRVPADADAGWRVYWGTGDIDAAAARVVEAGGLVTTPPHPIHSGDWIFHALDPEGVFFGAIGSRS